MVNYKTMYFELARRVADAIDLLIKAQQDGEEAFLEDEPTDQDHAQSEESQTDE